MQSWMSGAVGWIAAACLAVTSLPGAAGQPVRVRISSDVQATYLRLQYAASLACGPVYSGDLARYIVWDRCYRATLLDAIEQVNQPALLALHRRRTSGMAGG